ncbi:MAG: endonuclease/exonuclease/phosphatase family protein, partial [Planctomycetaceae bacterium]|nr:endonuclease/exonuclease/phosphatase family protein [Planctomycetaceae bacterium]
MRVMSYNIQKGYGGRDRKYDLERTIAVIEHENPDIICLQEVDHNMNRTRFHDQPKILRDHFGYEGYDYQWNHKIRDGGYGNLILSRYPLDHVHHVDLKLEHKKVRGAQIAVIATPEGPFMLVSWHLGLAEKQRHNQVNHFLQHPSFLQHADLPTLIVGDYNDWRNTLDRQQFLPHGFEQVTKPARQFRSFPAYLPLGSLDKAFVRGSINI